MARPGRHQPGLALRGLGVGDPQEDRDFALHLVHIGHTGAVELRHPGTVVEVHVEPVDPAVVGVDSDIPLEVLAPWPAFSLQLWQPSTQDPWHWWVAWVPLGVIVWVPQPVLLALGEALVVAVLGVVPVLGQFLAVVVVLGQVPGVLVPGVREPRVVLRVVLARDGVETGVVPVPVPVLWMLAKVRSLN